jgi:hypothetical protein
MSSEPSRHNETETRTPNSFGGQKLALVSFLTVLAAILITLLWGDTANLFGLRRLFGSSARSAAVPLSASASAAAAAAVEVQPDAVTTGHAQPSMKTPIYFLSHGGVSYRYTGSYHEPNADLIPTSQTLCTKSTTRLTASSVRLGAK